MPLPACGLYRTTVPIAEVAEGRLVYFHNHGDPGPGVYLPSAWHNNRATFHRSGVTLPAAELASTLHPLPREGFYRVVESFTCCEKRCRTFAPDALLQLGYNGEGRAIVFVPTLREAGLTLPERGTVIDDDRLRHLERLLVAEAFAEPDPVLH